MDSESYDDKRFNDKITFSASNIYETKYERRINKSFYLLSWINLTVFGYVCSNVHVQLEYWFTFTNCMDIKQ